MDFILGVLAGSLTIIMIYLFVRKISGNYYNNRNGERNTMIEKQPGTLNIAKTRIDFTLPTEDEVSKMNLSQLMDYLTEEDKIELADFCRDRIATQEYPSGIKIV